MSSLLIFLFMTLIIGVVLILISLKLLQIKQSKLINRKLPYGHINILNSNNNKKNTQYKIARGHYIYLFTNFKITVLKKLKKNIFNQYLSIDWLYLLEINEIHLLKEWVRQFRSLYIEIEKVQKKIITNILLIGIFLC